MIYVKNLREVSHKDLPNHIRIDRQSIFGNPFHMETEDRRDMVINAYEKYFYERIANDEHFARVMLKIVGIARKGDLYLYCWCAPKRCHGDIIKYYIEKEI